MKRIALPYYYLQWHYSESLKNTLIIWRTILLFIYHFFSIPFLFKTLFDRFERIGEPYPDQFNLEEYAEDFLVNSMMRIVGFFVRLIVIVFGLLVLLATVFSGILFFLVWFFFPFVLIGLCITGISVMVI